MSELFKQLAEMRGITPEEALEEAIQFAYANAKLSNDDITIEMIRDAFGVMDKTIQN